METPKKSWELRMVGGPYDGWKIPFVGEKPDRYYFFVGMPFKSEFALGEAFSESKVIPLPKPLPRIDYCMEMGVRDRDRFIALYVYRGPDTRRVY